MDRVVIARLADRSRSRNNNTTMIVRSQLRHFLPRRLPQWSRQGAKGLCQEGTSCRPGPITPPYIVGDVGDNLAIRTARTSNEENFSRGQLNGNDYHASAFLQVTCDDSLFSKFQIFILSVT